MAGTAADFRYASRFAGVRGGTTVGLRRGTMAPAEPGAACWKRVNISERTYSTKLCIWRFISSMRSRICRMMPIPAMFTPRSRARFRINSRRIAFGTGRFQQPLALVEPERLRVNPIHLGYRRDHICAFGFASRNHDDPINQLPRSFLFDFLTAFERVSKALSVPYRRCERSNSHSWSRSRSLNSLSHSLPSMPDRM